MDKSRLMIVAELSANHNQDKQLAIDTVIAAKKAGADAIKLQTYTPDTMTIDCDNEYFRIDGGTLWDGKTLYNLYREAYTPWEWHKELYDLASELDMLCFSTPFDKSAVDFLEQLDNPIYKIASFEITDIPLIRYIARLLKPVIISSGIATLSDIELAIQACREQGNNDITLLKCTSAYPASLDEANLLTIPVLKDRFNVKIGLSDHTLGDIAPLAATSLGAEVIEKHFILDRKMGGADAAFSMEPSEFKTMVTRVREVEKALGSKNMNSRRVLSKAKNFLALCSLLRTLRKERILRGQILDQ